MSISASRSPADTAAQIRELETDLLTGRPVREAVAAHRERNHLDAKRARRDFGLLRRRWEQLGKWSRDHSDAERGRSIARAELIYQRAIEAGDVAAAIGAARLRAELTGLIGPATAEKGPTC